MITNVPGSLYNQGTTQRLTGTLTDEEGTAILTSSLTTLTATLVVKATGAVINSRSAQSILNANGGTYTDGALVLTLGISDNTHNGLAYVEEHVLTLRWTYSSGTKAGNEEILLRVRDVGAV